jgi:hypothetical protein
MDSGLAGKAASWNDVLPAFFRMLLAFRSIQTIHSSTPDQCTKIPHTGEGGDAALKHLNAFGHSSTSIHRLQDAIATGRGAAIFNHLRAA